MMIRVLKNFSGGGATLPDFLHVGVRDVWPNAQHELRLGDNLLRCFQNCCFSPYKICPNREDLPLRKGAPKGPAVSQTRFLARGSSEISLNQQQ